MWWVQSPESMDGYTIKHKDDMQQPSYITSETLGHLVAIERGITNCCQILYTPSYRNFI